MIQFIQECIERANAEQSKLTAEAIAVPGMTGNKIRHFLNNVCGRSDVNYLEVGLHKGATFIAANFENSLKSSIAIDNWCQFQYGGWSRTNFEQHVAMLLPRNNFKLLPQDAFSVTQDEFSEPVNVYLYDGSHDDDSHFRALGHFYEMLDSTFIYLVDDWGWFPSVESGTRRAIRDLKLNVLFEQYMPADKVLDPKYGWWLGFYICVLEKQT